MHDEPMRQAYCSWKGSCSADAPWRLPKTTAGPAQRRSLHAAVLSVSAQYEPRQNDVEKRTDAYQVVTETTGLVS